MLPHQDSKPQHQDHTAAGGLGLQAVASGLKVPWWSPKAGLSLKTVVAAGSKAAVALSLAGSAVRRQQTTTTVTITT